MIQVAMTDSLGQVMSVFTPGGDGDYVDGQVYGDYTARHISPDEDPTTFILEWYWTAQGWQHRGERPTINHTWSGDAWVLDTSLLTAQIRVQRNKRLFESDWTILPDSPLTAEQKTESQTYRQALRDLIAGLDFSTVQSIDDVTWPTAPSFIA